MTTRVRPRELRRRVGVSVRSHEVRGAIGAVHLEPLRAIRLLAQSDVVEHGGQELQFGVVVSTGLQAHPVGDRLREDVAAHAVVHEVVGLVPQNESERVPGDTGSGQIVRPASAVVS